MANTTDTPSRWRTLAATDPEIAGVLKDERHRQNTGRELIASENFVSQAVMEAQGSVLTNKYAEGYPGKRYYGGCEFVDVAESLAIARAKELFGAEHANVLAMGGRIVAPGLADEIVKLWLETPFEGGRNQRRIEQITDIENGGT